MEPLRSALVLAALLALAGCSRGEEAAEAKPAGHPPPAPAPAPVAPDPELEALGLKIFGAHRHERQSPEPHYRKEISRLWLENRVPSENEMERRRSAPGIVSVEIVDDNLPVSGKPSKCLVISQLIDLWSEADAKAWKKEMGEKYMITKDVGGHRWGKSCGAEEASWPATKAAGSGRFVFTITTYVARAEDYSTVTLSASLEKFAGFEHAFWRCVLERGGNSKLRKVGESWVYERHVGETADGAIWATADGMLVYISCGGKYPTELIEAYLEKYSSILSADYRMDLERWGREEMELRLARMDEALADPKEALKRKVYFYNEWVALRRFFLLPFDNAKCQTEEEHRALRKQLADWWATNKDKLRWNPKIRGFEAGE